MSTPEYDGRNSDRVTFLLHQDGVGWWNAPAPFVVHRHRAHTSGMTQSLGLVNCCPCGAKRFGGYWLGERWGSRRVSWVPRRVVDFAWLVVVAAGAALLTWGIVSL